MPKKSRIISDREYTATLKGINRIINRLILFIGLIIIVCEIVIIITR